MLAVVQPKFLEAHIEVPENIGWLEFSRRATDQVRLEELRG